MNFVDGTIDSSCKTFISNDFSLPLRETQLAKLKTGTGQVTLGIRPEHIQILSAHQDGALAASVYITELMGNETFVFLILGQNKLIARAPAEFRADVESKVWVSLAMDKAHFFDQGTGERIGD
jgi:multiple sugar transport system ATP-binding protein